MAFAMCSEEDGYKRMAELNHIIRDGDDLREFTERKPHKPHKQHRPHGSVKRARLDRLAADMRQRNLTQGTGCKSQARAIAKRTGDL
jgi:hypothetical protein